MVREGKAEEEGSDGDDVELFGEAAKFHKPGKCTVDTEKTELRCALHCTVCTVCISTCTIYRSPCS